jgi:hypothetical protein
MCGSFDGGDAPMRRLVSALAVLPLLLIASAGFAEDEDEEPSVFVEYLRGVGYSYAAGFNGFMTSFADPVGFAIEGDEVFESLPGAKVTGRIVGVPAGIFQGLYRAVMGLFDITFAVIPGVPIVSPVPRYRMYPFEHPDE